MKILNSYFLPLTSYFLLFTSLVFSQTKTGTVEIVQDEKIKKLVARHIAINDSLGTIHGYRLQLFFTSGVNGKKMAQEVQSEFIRKYPGTESYLVWDSPNYKVRVGDFRTRLDALKFQEEIKVNFPNAYIVSDEINLPKM